MDARQSESERARQALRTPRAAGVAGIVFAVLLGAAIVLVRTAVPADPATAGVWLTDPSHRRAVQFALDLIPFAGIFFLWFMAVVRARIGEAEDKFFATVFLGSGLLFVATLFAVAAAAASLLVAAGAVGSAPDHALWAFGHHFTYSLLTTYSMRMAAVFTFSASMIAERLGRFPRWLAWLGYLCAVTLLVAASTVAWLELVFPIWALIVSVHILVDTLRRHRAGSAV